MIEKIDNNQIPEVLKEVSKQPQSSNRSQNSPEDASLQISNEYLIEQAKNLPSENTNAVEQARRLILSGQLDTPENIKAAAQAIAKFGI